MKHKGGDMIGIFILIFLYVDIYAVTYFITKLFMPERMLSIISSGVFILIVIWLNASKSKFKNPYSRLKSKLSIVLAFLVNILMIFLLIKSFYA